MQSFLGCAECLFFSNLNLQLFFLKYEFKLKQWDPKCCDLRLHCCFLHSTLFFPGWVKNMTSISTSKQIITVSDGCSRLMNVLKKKNVLIKALVEPPNVGSRKVNWGVWVCSCTHFQFFLLFWQKRLSGSGCTPPTSEPAGKAVFQLHAALVIFG